MGVETIAYSIPPKMMRKIRRNLELLDNIFDLEAFENASQDWKFEKFYFSKVWEEIIKIIGNCYPKTRNRLQTEKYWDYPDLDPNLSEIWTVTPSVVKAAADELAPATFEELKKRGLEMETTDYYGKLILDDEYESYCGQIEEFKKFLKKTAEAGNYLLFATL
jgi:hypothetical protein